MDAPQDGEDNDTIHGNRVQGGYRGLYPADRAAVLEDEAQKLGLERPTEGMIASAINDAVSDVLMWVGGPWHDRYYDDRLASLEQGRRP